MYRSFFLLCVFSLVLCSSAFSQGLNLSANDILSKRFHNYLEHNFEYLQQIRLYEQNQKTIDSCYQLLDKSALTIRNAVKKFKYPVRKKILAIIEAAKNDKSGDIYDGFKTFDDPTMNRIKATIRVPTLYECEIAILKARLRKKKIEAWANELAFIINDYYYPEFVRYELNQKLETYQQLLPIEQNIDKVLVQYRQNPVLPIEQNFDAFKQLVYLWEINARMLRDTDERFELLNYLKTELGAY